MRVREGMRRAVPMGLLVLCFLPWVMGAGAGDGAAESTPDWIVRCKQITFMQGATRVEPATTCETFQQSFSASPACGAKPGFTIEDGVIRAPGFAFDPAPLLGFHALNTSDVMAMHDPLDPTNKSLVFAGHVPEEEDSNEAPRVFVLQLAPKKFDPSSTEQYLLGLRTLPLPMEENRGCRTVHVAVAAPLPGGPKSFPVYVSTCQHLYRFWRSDDGWVLDGMFHDEVSDAWNKAHRRSEMEIVPLAEGKGHLLVWSFVKTDGQTSCLRMVRIDANGDLLPGSTSSCLAAETTGSIKGIEIAKDGKHVFFTHAAKPTVLFDLAVMDATGKLVEEPPAHEAKTDLPILSGSSQVELGKDGNLYLFGATDEGCGMRAALVGIAFDGDGHFASASIALPNTDPAPSTSPIWPGEAIGLMPRQIDGYEELCGE